MVQPPSCTGVPSRSAAPSRAAQRLGAHPCVPSLVCPWRRGLTFIPNQPLNHPPLPQLLPEGSIDLGWVNLSRAGPNSSPSDPPFAACEARGAQGSSRTPPISSCPGSRGQISCRENIPVPSQRSAFRFHVLSSELLLASLSCLSFFLSWGAMNGQGPVCLSCSSGLVTSQCRAIVAWAASRGSVTHRGAWEFVLDSLSDALQVRPANLVTPSP